MKQWKERLAAALSVLLLVSALPTAALAENAEGAPPPADEVSYNLGTMEVTVGSDPEKAETAETPYDLFDEDGDYVLALEPDAFFPYEVQFTCGDDTWTEWFMDAEDTVTVGGHTFSVESAVNDPEALTGLSFEVSGQTVTAYPEEKEFTNDDSGIAVLSLLPLREFNMRLDMSGYLPEELKNAKVSAVLSGMQKTYGAQPPAVKAEDVVVWSKGYDSDDFTVTTQDGVMDLTAGDRYNSTVYLTLIVGSGHQLDPASIRYSLRVDVTPVYNLLSARARTADGQTEIPVHSAHTYSSGGKTIFQAGLDKTLWKSGQEACLTLALDSDFERVGTLAATVYSGYYSTEEAALAAGAADLTGEFLNAPGHRADYGYRRNYQGMPEVTLVLKRAGQTVLVQPMVLYTYESGLDLSLSYLTGTLPDGGEGTVQRDGNYDWDDAQDVEAYTATLKPGFPANGRYHLKMEMYNPADDSSDGTYGISYVTHAAVGDFRTAAAIQAQPDIKAQLFSRDGYQADFSGGVFFSVLDVNGEIHQLLYKTVESTEDTELPDAPRPDSVDTYFRMECATINQDVCDSYVMPYDSDGYYYKGYQTVFLLQNAAGGLLPVPEGATILPSFYTGNLVTMYAGIDHTGGQEQTSGVTPQEFHNGKVIQYSAAAESKGHLKNYWVTFLTRQTGGPSLFVNAANDPDRVDAATGLPVREVYLTDAFDNHHDVFFANIGDEAMQGVYVRLEDAANVALDGYWTVREDAPETAKSLAAFTATNGKDPDGKSVSYGELANVAKVRLVPAEGAAGPISGTLVIGYDNGDGKTGEVKIKLTGVSGETKIVTDTLANGVKYVPYNSVIMTNSMGASDAVSFSVTGGSLPAGVTLYPNGKLYGMPTKAGTYTFTATAAVNGSEADRKTFTIVIAENTDANVDAATDEGYKLLDRFPGEIVLKYKDATQDFLINEKHELRSEGEFDAFYKLYLDGKEMTPGTDYTASEGSTRITVWSETLRDKGAGTHTISMEFRTNKGDTNTVKKAAQNYTLKDPNPGSGSGSGGTSKPAVRPGTADSTVAKTTADIFRDITVNDWFYPDVDWAYQGRLMLGVTGDIFAPYGLISAPTMVTVLARMDKADLSRYDNVSYPEIQQGQWYTNAAVWAKETGLLSEGEFIAAPPLARAKFAVMLVKYLQSKGIDCTVAGEPIAFADADQMTQEENDAFQALYQFGIFKGVGGYRMDAQGSTTRAQLAVLLHRLSVFVKSRA